MIKSENNKEFLYHYFKSMIGQNQIKEIVGTAGQPKFNKTDFKKIVIKIPKDRNEVKEFVQQNHQLNILHKPLKENYVKQKLNALFELKKSILEKAFNGEL